MQRRSNAVPLDDATTDETRQPLVAVQVHVLLNDIEPQIWRRLVVPLDDNLADLHRILQAAMGWTDSHLHELDIGGLTFEDIELLNSDCVGDEPQTLDSSKIRLRDFSRKPGTSFAYIYDFCDNWVHTVTLEKLVANLTPPKQPVCIEGARCCPPKDVGRPGSYEDFVRVLFHPENDDEIEEQKNLQRWSGGKFDPEQFDLDKTDKAVRSALRKRRTV